MPPSFRVFSPQLNLSRSIHTGTIRVCLLGDSRFYQVSHEALLSRRMMELVGYCFDRNCTGSRDKEYSPWPRYSWLSQGRLHSLQKMNEAGNKTQDLTTRGTGKKMSTPSKPSPPGQHQTLGREKHLNRWPLYFEPLDQSPNNTMDAIEAHSSLSGNDPPHPCWENYWSPPLRITCSLSLVGRLCPKVATR